MNTLNTQKNKLLKEKLISLIIDCPEIVETLEACTKYGLKDYYVAGGAITQIIWNNLNGESTLKNVKDFDIVYYSKNEKREQSKIHQLEIEKLISHKFPLDITNQAYVHEWYPEKFGNKIKPFNNTENGIQTWLSAFAIGIRKTKEYQIYAPYGLKDAFNMLVKPNKLTMSEDNYIKMTNSFKKRWENIQIDPWK
ncbi:nucleotidyltransferase family protein [Tenacibaculum aiptasiae]|uniref:nucleotidyltransferase family protein n=1 Tax=Tenacibaculum aiptasiae TaxID=426481 RepID=UPI00232ADE4C|nr:nucleotidyltransferase family protein [Tenacibaculum aiptasiae]